METEIDGKKLFLRFNFRYKNHTAPGVYKRTCTDCNEEKHLKKSVLALEVKKNIIQFCKQLLGGKLKDPKWMEKIT